MNIPCYLIMSFVCVTFQSFPVLIVKESNYEYVLKQFQVEVGSVSAQMKPRLIIMWHTNRMGTQTRHTFSMGHTIVK